MPKNIIKKENSKYLKSIQNFSDADISMLEKIAWVLDWKINKWDKLRRKIKVAELDKQEATNLIFS